MEFAAVSPIDFITIETRQPTSSQDAAYALDLAALADAERADAETFRLA